MGEKSKNNEGLSYGRILKIDFNLIKMSIDEIKKFITDDLNNKAKDIERFTQEANEQEVTVCRFFIGWAVASIGALTMLYLGNPIVSEANVNYSLWLYLRESLLPLSASVFLGILDHFLFFHRLLNKSQELDKTIRQRIVKIVEKSNSEDELKSIKDEILKEYKEQPAIIIGFKGFLYAQIAAFLFAVLVVACAVFYF